MLTWHCSWYPAPPVFLVPTALRTPCLFCNTHTGQLCHGRRCRQPGSERLQHPHPLRLEPPRPPAPCSLNLTGDIVGEPLPQPQPMCAAWRMPCFPAARRCGTAAACSPVHAVVQLPQCACSTLARSLRWPCEAALLVCH